MAHLCAIRLLVTPLSAPKDMMQEPIKAVIDWMGRFITAAEQHEEGALAVHVEWPKGIMRCLKACVEKKRGITYNDVREMLVNDPGAFREGRVGRF